MSHLEKINLIIEKAMAENQIPGAAIAIIKDREILILEGYGTTTIEEWGTPVGPHTLFRIASVSKLFTGTVLMMLSEKAVIDLDQTVQYYVPWFTTADTNRSKHITIRMLLSHSSGLPTGGGVSFHHNEDGLFKYMKDVVPTLPILFQPGTAYSYGNHSLNIAGFVAEYVTGKKFETLMQEMLFNPLEMTQTTYNPLKAMTHSLALPHKKDADSTLSITEHFLDDVASYPSYYSFSSIQDLSKFAMMHLQNGSFNNKQIVVPSTFEEMRSEQSKWYTLSGAGCGITFFKETKEGIERFWHYGQYSNQYSSQFILVPEKGIAVIALANGENIFQAGYEIVDELLKEETHTSQPVYEDSSTVPDWDSVQGTYLHSYYGLVEIEKVDGKVFFKHAEEQYELHKHSSDTYFCKDETGSINFTVGFPSKLKEKLIVVNSKACPAFNHTYIPNKNDWENFIGTYSDGIDSYKVSLQNETLIIHDLQSNLELAGRAITPNQFLTKEYGLVSFIEVNNILTLEFDYAWRYEKQETIVQTGI